MLKECAVPYSLYTPRKVPLPLYEKVRYKRDCMESLDVISKVTQPTFWCAGTVIVPKRSGNVRICCWSQIKAELLKPTLLVLYDPQAETKVSAYASSYGLGGVLLQTSESVWKSVAYASSETEGWYDQIEKEALAVTWACERFSMYLLGRFFSVETDHKPFVPLLSCKHLDDHPHTSFNFVRDKTTQLHIFRGTVVYGRCCIPHLTKSLPVMRHNMGRLCIVYLRMSSRLSGGEPARTTA